MPGRPAWSGGVCPLAPADSKADKTLNIAWEEVRAIFSLGGLGPPSSQVSSLEASQDLGRREQVCFLFWGPHTLCRLGDSGPGEGGWEGSPGHLSLSCVLSCRPWPSAGPNRLLSIWRHVVLSMAIFSCIGNSTTQPGWPASPPPLPPPHSWLTLGWSHTSHRGGHSLREGTSPCPLMGEGCAQDSSEQTLPASRNP